jgi:Fe-S cluster assembly iron-binding protein IscA
MKFTVTPAAVEQIKKTQPKISSVLRISRISVKGGGYSGFQYALQWVEGLIRDAMRSGRLGTRFTPADVNRVLGIHWAGTFLSKHRVGNPGGLRNCSFV